MAIHPPRKKSSFVWRSRMAVPRDASVTASSEMLVTARVNSPFYSFKAFIQAEFDPILDRSSRRKEGVGSLI